MHILSLSKQTQREEIYKEILPQIKAVISTEKNLIANLANITAILKQAFDFFWVGFYIETDGELVLGPFQGPLACTRIPRGKGVCGKAWQEMSTLIVPNVDEFKDHIACSSESRSEIVVAFELNNIAIVLDIDSKELDYFNTVDKEYLENIAAILQYNSTARPE